MSRRRKGPYLYLRERRGRPAVWAIRDGTHEVGTGCGPDDVGGAEEALARYYRPPGALAPDKLFVEEVFAAYLNEHAKHSDSRDFLVHTAGPILAWWAGKKLSDINGGNCRAYVTWRTGQAHRRAKAHKTISDQTARHDLKTLRTAINWYHREHGPLPSVPIVTLPQRAPQKQDYWLTRNEVAARVRAARKNSRTAHVARQLLIGVYTGTRPGAILQLMWMASPIGGWFDLDAGVLHRRGTEARRTKKRQPPARIPARLLPHLKRWRAIDMAKGICSVIHYRGAPVKKLRNSWNTVAHAAGATRMDSPHITRHTAATWQMQQGTNLYEAADYLGMTPETLWETYGHRHPDFQSDAAAAAGARKKRTK